MDPITHTMTGAALAGGGLRHRTPLATATLVVAANAPDVDVLAYLAGPYHALALRRGLTHGLPAVAALPALVAGGVLAWDRWIRRRRRPTAAPARPAPVLGLAFLGVLTHPVLDWMNTYGMRWWLPFEGGWSYGDALFIVDPWIWLVLGGALFLGAGPGRLRWWLLFWGLAALLVVSAPVPVVARLTWGAGLAAVLASRAAGVGAASGAGGSGGPDPAARLVRRASLAAVLYVAAMVGLDLAGRRAVGSALEAAGAGPVRELVVSPEPADPFAGEVVARTGRGDLRGRIRWAPGPRVELEAGPATPAVRAGAGVEAGTAGRAAAAARSAPDVRRYLAWSRLPTFSVTAREGGWSVRVGDARYPAIDGGGLGGPTVELDGAFRIREVR